MLFWNSRGQTNKQNKHFKHLDCGREHDSRQQETRLAKLALDIKESALPDGQMFMLNLPGSASLRPVGHFIRFIVMGAWEGGG